MNSLRYDLERSLRQALRDAIATLFQLNLELETISINASDRAEFGDLSCPLLSLAKQLHTKPIEIAEKVQAALPPIPYVAKTTVTAPGYVNFFLDFPALWREVTDRVNTTGGGFWNKTEKVLIEHTSVNPNKAAHTGHLRNAVLGDSLARIYRFAGAPVEVQNYIDDLGVQVADVVTALTLPSADYEDRPQREHYEKPDYFYWDLYTWFNAHTVKVQQEDGSMKDELDPKLETKRKQTMHAIEAGDPDVTAVVDQVATEVVDAHLATMARLGIAYDLLVWESDIIKLKLWEHVFNLLKAKKAVHYRTAGVNQGTWVVEYGDPNQEKEDKILVRSDGSLVYTAKDIAYQMWKFGLVDIDFHYRLWPTQSGLWSTTSDANKATGGHPHQFGRAARVINVIDKRQAYPQEIVYKSLANLGFSEQSANSLHLAYDVVSLSPATAERMGIDTGSGAKSYPMSGRKGIGVKIDDFIDQTIAAVKERTPEVTTEIAEGLAIATIRYYMLSLGADKELTFDIDQALKATGNTGVYIMYSYARAANILAKVSDDIGPTTTMPDELSAIERTLILKLASLDQAIRKSIVQDDPNHLIQYVFELATGFSTFYESTPILKGDPHLRPFRLQLVALYQQTLANAMNCLGIPPLDKI
ncbi:MAG: arginyl-tRNA synthetase, arginyl-tRNA synthetase [candidate division Kazan bacterium GW2011_GWA1_50_15]|uniref:arginine--tRNA ligase n=2 Tax=Bacteria division Kazan-3B-28 TaxID=1798534 RepID=A0A0G1X615_UNCK3|nr:MAG: arginyl-tRNA synthetase, arginyl-tRNA synthetase [candidate division Kazan bacterium GW2011_GWA1_50_15]KKW25933.1 MAG: Arginine-tRNA ligase [candidate division Kazan bacterium GW2011_GWC1_52_13]KKW26588.1 MAG: Arginine-tRNA ligase [candidate division Kazan bacterium GW2011_GWB1_52_7]HAV65686.1 arginine--tRNA ligase [Patescibacteria group bacterium]HCR42634.1 arginine--tRNA ligase [Patescibacteria group bacterium]